MTAPATPPDWEAIARYLAGESNADEAAVVRSWLEANPDDRALVQRLDNTATIDFATDVDIEAALTRVHEKMSKPERPPLRVERGGAPAAAKPRRRGAVFTLAGIAAAAVAAFVITQGRANKTPIVNVAVNHFTTGVGKTDSVRLADGSRVILGPQSTLEVPGTFGASERIVTLTGDAFFEVKHDASKPFSVRAGTAVIQDIGTTFTIESDNDSGATVSVVEGSVRLSRESSGPASGVVLAAGDRGSLGATGDARVEHNVVRDEDTQWISGRLAFRDAPLSRIAAEIQRWYGVKLTIADSALLDRKVTTSFEGESIDKALQILELTLGAKITRQGDSAAIVSSPRGARSER